jgi:hypothetical protein
VLAFEDDKPDALDEALAALGGLARWFKEQGVEDEE